MCVCEREREGECSGLMPSSVKRERGHAPDGMNALGLSLIVKMGCICTRETVNINGVKYVVKERLGEG